MKKFLYSLIGIFICSIDLLVAQPIDVNMAQRVAENFYNAQNQHKNNVSLSLYCAKNAVNVQKSGEKGTYYYIFNDESNGGFVLVSGDKRVEPILGYSTEGKFDTTNMPDNLRYWLKGYEDEIDYAIANFNEAPQESAEKWNNYINNIQPKNRKAVVVAPLIQTQWGQGTPYNNLCPYDYNAGQRSVTGCVATAMAQIMKYFSYPTTGRGSHYYVPQTHPEYGTLSANFANTTYQWSSMPNTLTSYSSSAAKTAVSTLMYHCGVAVDMDYDVSANGGSGAVYTLPDTLIKLGYMDANTALWLHFGYQAYSFSRSEATYADWIAALKLVLDKGIPILYGGSGSNGGHAFVCDGYQDNNQFHFNWGWSGTDDGYFYITSLNTSNGSFNSGQDIIIAYPNIGVDLRFYSNITITANPIYKNTSFSVSASIGNYGNTAFSGTISFDILDSAGNYKGEIGSMARNIGINSYGNVAITCSSGVNYPAGTYYMTAYYKEDTSSSWKEINGGIQPNWFPKYTQFIIKDYPKADLHLFNTISVSSTTIYPDSSISVTANIVNQGDKAFTGKIGLDLYNNSGVFLQTLVEANHTLAPSASQTISVNQSALSYPVGTYYIVATYTEQDSAKKIIGNMSDRKYFDIVPLPIPKAILSLQNTIILMPTTIYPDSSISVTANIVNQGDKAFIGKIGLDLYNNSGVFLQTLVEANHTLAPSASQTIRVNQFAMSYPVGTYYIVATYTEQDSAKKIIGNMSDRKYFDIVNLTMVNMALYSAITISPERVYQNTPLAVSVTITNNGNKDFDGKLGIDLYSNDGVYMETLVEEQQFVAKKQGFSSLATINANHQGFAYPAGRYYLVATYTEKNSSKKVIGTTSDRKYFNIETNAVNIQLFSDININPNEVYKNTAFAVSASVINSGNKDFIGYISFDVYNASDDTYVGELDKVEETVPHATYKTITINRNGINYADGRYYITSSYMEKDSLKWKSILSDKYNTKAYFEIKAGVNIEEHQTWQAVLYPNPSTDKFILKTTEILDNTIAEIFDMTGKSLYKTTINSQETILDLTSFSQGVYILKVTNKDNLHTYKFIKQ
ncbi:MAG: thiol protease/hemagglutinin PrtT [Bacteroidales bacterium]|nr:thiol protease/hemagglutinin PrtT [Bacteroidales bacterium]